MTVTHPIPGSRSSPTASTRTSRTAALTRRMRSLIRRHHLSLDSHQLVFLSVQVAHRLLEQPLGLAMFARDAGDGQAAPLPEVMVVDLGDGGAEAVLELRLRRLDVLALALERPGLGKCSSTVRMPT